MKLNQFVHGIVSGILLANMAGCASIIGLVDPGSRRVQVTTFPSGAKVTVYKLTGEEVTTATTPATIPLKRFRGYMKAQDYKLKIELEGYKSVELEVKHKFNAWYIGNILIGGLIGMLIVDPLTGAMWRVSPNKIEQLLSAEATAQIGKGEAFAVILKSDATENELNAGEPLVFGM